MGEYVEIKRGHSRVDGRLSKSPYYKSTGTFHVISSGGIYHRLKEGETIFMETEGPFGNKEWGWGGTYRRKYTTVFMPYLVKL